MQKNHKNSLEMIGDPIKVFIAKLTYLKFW